MSESNKQKKLKLTREILMWIFLFMAVLVVSLFIRKFIFYPVEVLGNSMETTYKEGDTFFVNRFVNVSKLDRYDVVVFKAYSEDNPSTVANEDGMLLVKRIIGLPGETVYVGKNNDIIVKGTDGITFSLDDKYCLSDMTHGINWNINDDNTYETVKLSEDEYFVLGDNRRVSLDSRDYRIKGVHFDSILGKYGFKKISLFKK